MADINVTIEDQTNIAVTMSGVNETVTTKNIYQNDKQYTCGATIGGQKVVYLSTDGKIYTADNSSIASVGRIVGMTIAAYTSGGIATVRGFGPLTGFSGLIAGSRYFVGTGGNLTATAPTSGFTMIMGNAIDSGNFDINIQTPIILA